jgi:hypothetical protein
MNSDGDLDTLEVCQRRPPRPASLVWALSAGLPRLLLARLLPIPPAILL